MKKSSIVYHITMYLIVLTGQIQGNFFSDIYDTYIKKWPEETIQQTYPCKNIKTLIIENPQGDIRAEGWHGDTIVVTMHKQAPSQEILSSLVLSKTTESPSICKISIHHPQVAAKGVVHLSLLVPKELHISLTAQHGALCVKHVQGNVTASTEYGAVLLHEVHGAIIAHTSCGSINIKKVFDSVKATTQYGSIYISDAHKSIYASTDSGAIDVSCKDPSWQSPIQLSTTSGTIKLSIPDDSNIDLYACTHNGTVTCDHFITTKPQTIQLNSKTWQRLKKEVRGIIGRGEALVKLTTTNGSIKIQNGSVPKKMTV